MPKYTIIFDALPEHELTLREHSDEAIDEARDTADGLAGGKGPGRRALPHDPRTHYPNFTVYEDGQEIGGG